MVISKRGNSKYYIVTTYLSPELGKKFEKYMKDHDMRKKSEAAYMIIAEKLKKGEKK